MVPYIVDCLRAVIVQAHGSVQRRVDREIAVSDALVSAINKEADSARRRAHLHCFTYTHAASKPWDKSKTQLAV